MSRPISSLLVALALVVGVLSPVAAQEATGGAADPTVTLTVAPGPSAIDSAPPIPDPKRTPPVEVDARAIRSAMSEARSLARSAGVSVSDGFLAGGRSSVIVTVADGVDPATVAAAVGGEILAEYRHALRGAAMIVPDSALKALGRVDGVTGVYVDRLRTIETDTSPAFIGAPTAWDAVGGVDDAGEGIVVGVIDTGIWPEHPSFSDPDPSGEPYPPPPPTWTGTSCDFGSGVPGDAPFTCNNKLVGATWSMPAYASSGLLTPEEFRSARDDDGHGTHTSSTAAGNAGVAAELLGVPRGTVSGIAPRAHVAMYKACGDLGCFTSDLVAAIDAAVADGVDVINYSIGGGQSNPYTDADALALLAAFDAGIFVATSAGNSGPGPNTVGSPGDAPWVATVGASTTNRHFISTVTLVGDDGDELELTGASVTAGIDTPTEVILADPADPLCLESTPGTFDYTGKIVACERGAIARVAKSYNVAQQGAVGMLLFNPVLQGLATDNHFIPSVHLEVDAGEQLVDFLAERTTVTATFTAGEATAVQGDVMAAFSSRGGDGYLTIKPDVTAPGVQILAGHTPMPATIAGGVPGELFQSIQGTSMSSPHVAGAAAVLMQMHPDWSPAQVKSALMMTAREEGLTKEDGSTPAGFFDRGSGRIDLSRAGSAVLTMDLDAADFLAREGREWTLNLPSVWIPRLPGKITVRRTVTSDASRRTSWKTKVTAPSDVVVKVPRKIVVPAGGEASFPITIDARRVPLGELRTAEIVLNGRSGPPLHIPVAFVRDQAGITIEKTCDPADLPRLNRTRCTITVENTTFETAQVSIVDAVPRSFRVKASTVSGATVRGNRLSFEGALAPATPPSVAIVEQNLFGYLPLAAFGVPPVSPPSNPDDGGLLVTGLDFFYAGMRYSDGIWSVNGTFEAGTASGVAAPAVNTPMPNPQPPNNLLAPWWTDLDLSGGGALYLAALTDGVAVWDVLEWADVPRFADPSSRFSFQIWIERGTDRITFVYGSATGDTAVGTVGAETADGTAGDQYWFDGTGTDPWTAGTDLAIATGAAIPGESHTITYTAIAARRGSWTNYVEMTSDAFAGTAIASVSGKITRPRPRRWRRGLRAD